MPKKAAREVPSLLPAMAPGIANPHGAHRISRLFTRLKISKLSRNDYATIIRISNFPSADPSDVFPFSMGRWLTLIHRLGFLELAPFPDWISKLYEFQQRLVETPENWRYFPTKKLIPIPRILFSPGTDTPSLHILRLWHPSVVSCGSQDRGSHRAVL